jgi:hypothetical protein
LEEVWVKWRAYQGGTDDEDEELLYWAQLALWAMWASVRKN